MPTITGITTTTSSGSTYALITRSRREIASLVPDVVVEEITTDTLRITDHPVETGAAISDHAFKMPVEIIMRCGFSNSSGSIGHFEGYSRAVWDFFVQLQQERQPFNVSTPKRTFSSMLVSMLQVTEDESTTHALNITVGLRQVIITNTSITASPIASAGSVGLAPITLPPILEMFGGG